MTLRAELKKNEAAHHCAAIDPIDPIDPTVFLLNPLVLKADHGQVIELLRISHILVY